MSDLIERMSRRLHWGFLCNEPAGETAADVAREVLVALRQPSDAALESAEGEFVFETWDEVRRGLGLLLDAFAREHGLEIPAVPRQEPQEGRSGDGTASGASDAENAPDAPAGPPHVGRSGRG